MAQIIDLGKIRFNWKGVYSASVEYTYNDLVKYGPNLYAFTATSAATGVVPTNTGSWALVTEGVAYKGVYTSGTLYYKNDIVTDNVSTYIVVIQHTADTSVAEGNSNLELLALGQEGIPNQAGNVNKVLTTDGTNASWTATTYLTKNYVGGAQGQGAANFETSAGLTDAMSVFSRSTSDFAQFPIVNLNNGANASTDFIAYTADGDNDTGWIDMGITSNNFSAATYGITGPHDGYIFMSGARGSEFEVGSRRTIAGVATLTTTSPHGYIVGDEVRVYEVGTGYDGFFTITAVPSNITFSYAVTRVPEAETAVTPYGSTWKPAGNGNLVLATTENGKENRIVFAAGGLVSGTEQMVIIPNEQVHIEIATQSTSPTTGALRVAGGVGVTGNINANGELDVEGYAYIGNGATAFATSATLTNPVATFKFDNDTEDSSFAQLAFTNADPTSSTDIIAYMDNGDDSNGWVGIGITGSNFDDTTYGITNPGDGYIFMNTIDNTYTGNLVFATGAAGSENKLIFAAGGFDSGLTQMEITPGVNVHIEIPTPSTSPTTGALTIVGGVGISGDVNIAGNITFGGSGTTVETENLAVEAPMIYTNLNAVTLTNDVAFVGENKYALAAPITATIVNKQLSADVATLTTSVNHSFLVGDSVVIASVDATFNGTYTITAVETNTFSYAKVAGNVASTRIGDVTRFVTNKALTSNVATLTTATAHGYNVGESVLVTGVDSVFNGTYTITAVTTDTFSYAKTNANVVSAVVDPAGTAVVNQSIATGTVSNPIRTRFTAWSKDATDGIWKLTSNIITKPVTTIDYSQDGLVYDSIKVGAVALASGATVSEFSTDTTLGGTSPSNTVVPTETAVKTYVDNILGNTASISLTSSNYTAAYGTTVLTVTSASDYRSVVLPSALSAIVGSAKFQVYNKSDVVIGIRNNSSELLTAVAPGGSALLALTDNSTAAGEWAVSGTELRPFFVANQAIIPNASATATDNNPSTNPIFSVSMTSSVDLNVHTNATGTISAYAVDYSTTPATASTTPLLFTTGSNYTIIGVQRVSNTRALVFTLTDVILLNVSGTTVTLVTNTNSVYTSPVRNGYTTASLTALMKLEDDLYAVMFGGAATAVPTLTVIKADGDVIRTSSLNLTRATAVVNGWDAIVTSSNTILMAYADNATTAAVAPYATVFTRIAINKGSSGANPSAIESTPVLTPTNIASGTAYSIVLSRDESNNDKVCAIVGNNTSTTINGYILTGGTTGTITLGSVFTVDTAASVFVASSFGQTPLTKALQNVGTDAWAFTYQGVNNFMRVARITASGTTASITLPTYHGKNPASNITTLGPKINNDVVLMTSHGQATTSYSGVLSFVNTGGTYQFKEFVPPAEGILFTTQRTYAAWSSDGWLIVAGGQTSTATAVLVQHNQFAVYRVSDKGAITYYGTYGLPINSNIGLVFNPQVAAAGRIKDSWVSTYYDAIQNIPYRAALDIEFIKV